MEAKKLWTSKTFWVNLLALIVMIVQTRTGFVINVESQVAILALINMALRMITKSEITWKKG